MDSHYSANCERAPDANALLRARAAGGSQFARFCAWVDGCLMAFFFVKVDGAACEIRGVVKIQSILTGSIVKI